jgi:putative ABC transport system substrate-binding protein
MTGDPIQDKLVTNVARPWGNLTGFSSDTDESPRKLLELLKEAAPQVSRVAVLCPKATWESFYGPLLRPSGALGGMTMIGALLDDPIQAPEYRRVFAAMVRERVDALFVGNNAENYVHRRLIVEPAAQARLPAIYSYRDFVEIGGLITYSADVLDQFHRAASYIDRILKGANPGELPYQQPTKFELVINLNEWAT